VSCDGKAANHVVKLALTLAYYRLAARLLSGVIKQGPAQPPSGTTRIADN
jgi:hypothetical protein